MLTEEKIQQIPLDLLIPSSGNRRIGGFDPDKLQQLADSIQAVGVQQPIVVRPNGQSKYEIVAGERRWKAAKIAGLLDIPAVVRDLDDVTVLKIQTIENLQREDLHPLDEADGYVRLIEKAGYDVELIAQEVGRSASYVYQRLKLQDLIPKARDMLIENAITAGHAILIARLQPKQQEELAIWIKDRSRWDPVSVRDLDDWIHRMGLLDLNKAAFKKDDPDLDPTAGPCTNCPKRTGYQPALFADVCKNGKKDYCTDPPCFNGKLAALVQRRRMELKESKEPHLEVASGYVNYQEQERLQKKGVKTGYTWEECKKKDEGAVRCLVVAGDSPGRLTWGRERKQNRYGMPEKTPEEKAKAKAERETQKAAIARRQKAFDEVIENAAEQLANGEIFLDHEDVLRFLAGHIYNRLWDQHRKKIRKLQEWEFSNDWDKREEELYQKLQAMNQAELRLFILKAVLIGSLEYDNYSSSNLVPLINIAHLFDIDVSELEAEREAALKSYNEQMAKYQTDEDFDLEEVDEDLE